MKIIIFYLIVTVFSFSNAIGGPVDCESWIKHKTKASKGIVLLMHGLNLKPEKMGDLAQVFSTAGYDVYIGALTGHCNDNDSYLNITPEQWSRDADRLYGIVNKRSVQEHLPLYLIAYSFSGLLFESRKSDFVFSKKVFFAVPFKLHFWFRPLVWITSFFPRVTFGSLNLPDYRANARSNFMSLQALNFFHKKWKQDFALPGDGINKLFWIDSKDELVNGNTSGELASADSSWDIRYLSVEAGARTKKIHHLIIDKASLGAAEWARVTSDTLNFLNSKK